VPVDSKLLLCEDFEAQALVDDVPVGRGSPGYGPWYDDTGYNGNRGTNSWWTRTYGPPGGLCSWTSGEPSNPQRGTACAFGFCNGGAWKRGDLWGANGHACMVFPRNGEFDDEIQTGGGPQLPNGSRGVFDGQAVIGHRVSAGKTAKSAAGYHGGKSFGRAVATIGITQALAYPPDVWESRVWANPWKDNQFQDGQEHWHRGSTGVGSKPDDLPYMPFRFGNCQAALANARVLVGQAQCNSLGIMVGPGNAYSQATDFPFGSWGCSQAYMSGMNTSNMTWKLWHNGRLIVHIEGIDGNAMQYKTYSNMTWNNYANANQSDGVGTNRATFRYEDNVHIREGDPVACSQIGYGASSPPTTPPPTEPPPTTPPPTTPPPTSPTLGKPGTPY
jgi:hypothetical protein